MKQFFPSTNTQIVSYQLPVLLFFIHLKCTIVLASEMILLCFKLELHFQDFQQIRKFLAQIIWREKKSISMKWKKAITDEGKPK